ncbi:MAG: DUF559 domain-containing protein [Pleurocapsa sp. MO_226.B13]|nr:DUF559 domain-containing protein [Pleurocapsa sp. MO_226.B13]
MVIEVDGKIHDRPSQINRDRSRTAKLMEYGYTVLRFRNEQVMEDLPQVLAEIKRVAFLSR